MSEAVLVSSNYVEIDFDVIFNDFIENNKKKWAHDRQQTAGASEVFDCLRKIWFNKFGEARGFEEDPDFVEDWGAMIRGDLIENYHVVPAVRDHMPPGMQVLFSGDEQTTLVLDRNSATPDGLITGLPKGCGVRIKGGAQDILIEDIESDCLILEIKSIDPRANLVEERDKHRYQTQIQMALFHEKTDFRPVYAIVLYIDASFLSNVKPFVVQYDPSVFKIAQQRAAEVWAAADPTGLDPEGRFDGGCKHCRWRQACGTATISAIPSYDDEADATPETVNALAALVADLKGHEEVVKTHEREVEIAKQRIKDFLSTKNARRLKTPEWSVSWYSQDGKKSLDKKAMEADGIDLEKYEREGASFDVLRVTPRNPDAPKATRSRKKKD